MLGARALACLGALAWVWALDGKLAHQIRAPGGYKSINTMAESWQKVFSHGCAESDDSISCLDLAPEAAQRRVAAWKSKEKTCQRRILKQRFLETCFLSSMRVWQTLTRRAPGFSVHTMNPKGSAWPGRLTTEALPSRTLRAFCQSKQRSTHHCRQPLRWPYCHP